MCRDVGLRGRLPDGSADNPSSRPRNEERNATVAELCVTSGGHTRLGGRGPLPPANLPNYAIIEDVADPQPSRPLITGSNHRLPFMDLDPARFEQLCLWLVGAEGWKRAEHLGSSGSDGGRDIMAFKPQGGDDQLWYLQCKRRARITVADLRSELNKISAFASTHPEATAAGVVFVIAGDVSAAQRDAIRKHASLLGLGIEFWARSELDERVKRHPRILAEFFQLPGFTERVRDPAELADAALTEGWRSMVDVDFDRAVDAFERAATTLAGTSHVDRERKARREAARALGEQVVYGRLSDKERLRKLRRIDEHLDLCEALGEPRASLLLERAMLARLRDDPARTLELASECATLAPADGALFLRAEALVAVMQACWQLDRIDEAIALADQVAEICDAIPEDEPRFVVAATWLRTRCKAGQAGDEEVRSFCDLVRASVVNDELVKDEQDLDRAAPLRPRRAALIVGEVAAEFSRSQLADQTLLLCELGYELAATDGSPAMRCNVALQTAELAIETGDRSLVSTYVSYATSAVEESRNRISQERDAPTWQTLRANLLYAQGRIAARLGWLASSPIASNDDLVHACGWFVEAIAFANQNRAVIGGDIDDFCTEVRWWLARAKKDLNEDDEAAALFRVVRTAPAMANPSFVEAIGMEAWLMEADSLLWAGRGEEAKVVAQMLIDDGRASEEVMTKVRNIMGYLDNVVLPNKLWLRSSEANAIGDAARRRGLGEAVSEQVAPLVEWWRSWRNEENGHESELMDYWGRGGFARVAAALRARPHAAIAVDAASVNDIRRWARILCPLFETVVVKWKGEFWSGFIVAPVHESWGGPGSFGGHGYSVLLGSKVRDDWYVAASQGSLLPEAATRFLATEALDLVESGRLVVVPAPLVGCTQSSIGWTDHLLLEGLLGGVVNAIQTTASAPAVGRPQRVLDLARHTIPYMADISLPDLARVLDETDEWVVSLRSLLLRSLLSDDLRRENWASIAAIENEIKTACRELRDAFDRIGRAGGWAVSETDGAIAAGSTPDHGQPGLPVTELLRSLAADRPSLGPWIPYFRLGTQGGHLDWSSPSDLLSPGSAQPGGSWLFPGTAGAGIRTVRTA